MLGSTRVGNASTCVETARMQPQKPCAHLREKKWRACAHRGGSVSLLVACVFLMRIRAAFSLSTSLLCLLTSASCSLRSRSSRDVASAAERSARSSRAPICCLCNHGHLCNTAICGMCNMATCAIWPCWCLCVASACDAFAGLVAATGCSSSFAATRCCCEMGDNWIAPGSGHDY